MHSPSLSSSSISGFLPTRIPPFSASTNPNGTSISAAFKGDDRNREGKMVDQSMIVLRMRIQKMKTLESVDEAPSALKKWEKKQFVGYDRDVHRAVGSVQNWLMNTRPSLGLAMAALVSLIVPTSVGVFLVYVMYVINGFM